jgi:DNA-binding transcriptional regulator LsrR (DeoR family)
MDFIKLLKEKYPYLRNVCIVESVYDYGELKKHIGRAASGLLESITANCEEPRIGIGGGSTLFEMINSLDIKSRRLRIFPTALIGRGPEITHVDSTFLATMLYFKSRPQSKAFVINIPPLPDNRTSALNFLKSLKSEFSEVKWLINAMQHIDIAFIGLGAMIPSGDFDNELKKVGVTLQELIGFGVIGGINYNWFDSDGNQVTDYFPTISINQLINLSKQESKHIVLVAGGTHKIKPIHIALKMQMVNSIVSDEETVISLVREYNDNG